MLPGGIGAQELLLVFLIILVLFGARRLPEMGKGLGSGIRQFRNAVKGIRDEIEAGDKETEQKVQKEEEGSKKD